VSKLVWSTLCSPGVAVLVAFKLPVQGECPIQACSVHVEFTRCSSVGIGGVQASVAGGVSNPKLVRSTFSSPNQLSVGIGGVQNFCSGGVS